MGNPNSLQLIPLLWPRSPSLFCLFLETIPRKSRISGPVPLDGVWTEAFVHRDVPTLQSS